MGDLNNNDGKLDVGRRPGVLRPTSCSATATAPSPPATTLAGTGAYVTLVDVNRDGKPDIVLDNKLATFVGNGDGTFLPASTSAISGVGQIAVGDFDNDGSLDLAACTGAGAGVLRIMLGNGNGTYRAGVTLATGLGNLPVATADFNGDGKLDLVLGHGSYLGLLLGNGNGSFSGEGTYLLPVSAFGSSALTIADLNGDSRPDVVVGDPTAQWVIQIASNAQIGSVFGSSTALDQTAPTTTITAQPPSFWIDGAATFAFSGADPTANGISSGINHFEVSLDGAAFTTATSPATASALTNGSHTYRVRAVDNVSNVGTPASYTWTVDTTAPPTVVSLLHATPTATITNSSSVTYALSFDGAVTGVDSGDFNVVKTGSVTNGALTFTGSGASWSVTVNGIAGDGTLKLTLADNDSIVDAGNSLPLGGTGAGNGDFLGDTYTIDQTAPTATFTAVPAALTTTTVSFAFSGNDPTVGGLASGVNHFEGSIDGAPFVPVTNPIVIGNLPSGTNTYRIRAVDNAGNAGTPMTYSWTADRDGSGRAQSITRPRRPDPRRTRTCCPTRSHSANRSPASTRPISR